MQTYWYDGPVMKFDQCIMWNWKASTYAATEGKARSNLIYRFKKQYGLAITSKISLPGKLATN